MAIFHFTAKTVSRAEGRSSVAAASYRSGERMVDERTGEIHDFTRKSGVVGGGVVLPSGNTLTRSELWNKVEAKHKRGDAVVAREFELAIPHELTPIERASLISRYSRELADEYGVAVDWNLHAPDPGELNHHAHMMLSACYVSADGVMGKKCVELDPIHCKRAGILNPMETQRAKWQDLCNAALERAGETARIDHRTLEAQGITDRLPGVHMGPVATDMAKRGEVSAIEARAKRKADEFIGRVQADAAIQAAALRDVAELERELAKAKAEVARPRTRSELEAELEPMLAKLKTAQEVIDEGDRRRPTAKPLAKVKEAEKALPLAQQQAKVAKANVVQMRKTLDSLPWWRPFKRAKLARNLPMAQRHVDDLAKALASLEAMAKATPLETLENVVANNKAILANLSPQCWPIQRELTNIEVQDAAVRAKEAALEAAREAEQAKALAKVQQAAREAGRAYRRANPEPPEPVSYPRPK